MAATGVAGAIYDPAASQDTGALSTCIGFGINSVMGPGPGAAPGANFTDGVTVSALRIGSGSQAVNAIGFAGKGLAVEQNTNAAGGASIASGSAMSGTTSLNRSGSACPPGGYVVAVAP